MDMIVKQQSNTSNNINSINSNSNSNGMIVVNSNRKINSYMNTP